MHIFTGNVIEGRFIASYLKSWCISLEPSASAKEERLSLF